MNQVKDNMGLEIIEESFRNKFENGPHQSLSQNDQAHGQKSLLPYNTNTSDIFICLGN